MRLEEIRPTAGELRVRRLRASANAAKERSRQLKQQADINAERLEMKKAREKLVQLQRSSLTTNIKPIGSS